MTSKEILSHQLIGSVRVPPSKSVTHRAFILSALSSGIAQVRNPLRSQDTNTTLVNLKKMGASFDDKGSVVIFKKPISGASAELDCQNSGTTMRLLTGIAALFPEQSSITGDASLLTRPMGPLLVALEELGSEIQSNDGKPPLIVNRPVDRTLRNCEIDGSISSQFISSLLILSAVRDGTAETMISLIPPIVSKPYIYLTERMLEEAGIKLSKTGHVYSIPGQQKVGPINFLVPADFSSVAFFAVAGALPGNQVTVTDISLKYPQADSKIIEFLKTTGASVELSDNQLSVKHKKLRAFEFDISDCPDLFPILCVLACFCDGPSKIYGASHLKYKETDRIHSMKINLEKLGITFKALPDGAVIEPTNIDGGIEVDSYHDHRIAMALAVLGSQVEQGLVVKNAECVDVSYPEFFDDLARLSK